MYRGFGSLAGVALVGLVVVACHQEIASPSVLTHGINIVSVPLVSSTSHFSNSRLLLNKSQYQCQIVARHADGKYRKATGFLTFPQSMTKTGATRLLGVKWLSSGSGTPDAAVNCMIPEGPEAEQYFLEHILFIDPKARRATADVQARVLARPSPTILANDVPTLPGYIVIAQSPGWPGWFGGGNAHYDDTINHPPSINSWSDGFTLYYDPNSPCSNAGETGVVTDVASMTALSEEACPVTATETVCLDFWIAQCATGPLDALAGDCRPASDPYATPSASRVQMVIPISLQDAAGARTTISPTCLAYVVPPWCVAPLDTSYNKVQIGYRGTDTIAVSFSLRNSIEAYRGSVAIGPAIDGSVVFVKGSDGSFQIAWSRDAFPSMAVVRSKNGVNTLLLERSETVATALIDWMHLTDFGNVCVTP